MPFLETLGSYLETFSLHRLSLNWVDIVIVIVMIFYALEGFSIGFIAACFDLASFVIAFATGLRFYNTVGEQLVQYVGIPIGFANAFGFFITAFIVEIITNFLLRLLLRFLSKKLPQQSLISPNVPYAFLQTTNSLLGIIPAVISAVILLSFLFTMIVALPFSPYLKKMITSSQFANPLVIRAQAAEKSLNAVFGGAVSDTLNFLTVKPESDETVKLHFHTTDVTVDNQAEERMLVLVNKERLQRGLSPLAMDPALRELARSYSRKMFAEGYFSHYSPGGESPFDRMTRENILFTSAGENLALAPNVDLAMQGLMASTGHKANILSAHFGKIGIGVIDGGIYGEMFTQEFTD
ncbi:MAG: CvpA family protein [Candidatus Levybacteria bacterium]|nr:CvpA family protein [Candidatus Levybacteria bacterium]